MQIKKLKWTLRANALFSAVSGLVLVLVHNWLGQIMDITQPVYLLFIGVGLLIFAGFVFRESMRREISLIKVRQVIWQDWAWVVGSVVIIGTGAFDISDEGYVIMGGVALIIADFAILQKRFSRA